MGTVAVSMITAKPSPLPAIVEQLLPAAHQPPQLNLKRPQHRSVAQVCLGVGAGGAAWCLAARGIVGQCQHGLGESSGIIASRRHAATGLSVRAYY